MNRNLSSQEEGSAVNPKTSKQNQQPPVHGTTTPQAKEDEKKKKTKCPRSAFRSHFAVMFPFHDDDAY